jgi:AcrR family transcriptional regulator
MSRQKRSEAELQWRRERILAASAVVFQRVGFAAATMEEIARESEYSPAALYNYFRSKEDIFVAAMEQISERLVHALSEPVPDGLAFDQVIRFRARRMVELGFENSGILMALEGRDGPPSLGAQALRVGDCQRRTLDPWTRLMAIGQAQGALALHMTPEQLASAFIGLVRGGLVTTLTGESPPALPAMVTLCDHLIDLFLDGARRQKS